MGIKLLKLLAQFLIGSPCTPSRGGHFNVLLLLMRGRVFFKLAGLGVFLVQSGRFLVVHENLFIWIWGQIFEFWSHEFEFQGLCSLRGTHFHAGVLVSCWVMHRYNTHRKLETPRWHLAETCLEEFSAISSATLTRDQKPNYWRLGKIGDSGTKKLENGKNWRLRYKASHFEILSVHDLLQAPATAGEITQQES